jgi:hypothetical protein
MLRGLIMSTRDVASGASCLFEALVVVGYFAVAWLIRSWVMLLAPFAIAGIVLVWAIIESRIDED